MVHGTFRNCKLVLIPFLQLACLLCFSAPVAAAVQYSADARRGEPARPCSASRWRQRVALLLLHRFLLRAGASPAVPRRPEQPAGRHLNATMERSLQSPPPSPSAHTSITITPETLSPHSFACSSLPRPRTPPLRRTPASSSHRRAHTSALPRPQLTPSITPPHPHTAHGQLRLAQNSPEPLAVVARAPPPPVRSGTRSSAPPPPALTPPLAPPRPRAASRPLLVP